MPVMTTGPAAPAPGTVAGPRLLPYGDHPLTLAEHLALHGPPAYQGGAGRLTGLVWHAGLTGRGGAAFPTYRKMDAVLAAARTAPAGPVVVANAAEGEPAADKDKTLLRADPHLVLDGLQLAAEAVGARQAYLYLHRGEQLLRRVREALSQRAAAGVDQVPVTVVQAPRRFLAGQESALVHRIEGGPATPRYATGLVAERGVGGAPTLVQNVETLAHLALIARSGPARFRAAGTAAEPGTMLVTLHVANAAPHVLEAALGTPLHTLLALGHQPSRAVLVGGYHGTWLPADLAATLPLANEALREHGASLGAGVLAALPPGRCGLAETAGIVAYLVAESAGQCGPCLNGLPRIAHALAALARPAPNPGLRETVERWAGQVAGRGACHHPDGSVRLVRSALTVFADELRLHAAGVCSGPNRTPFLPLPAGSACTDEDWT